MLELCTFALFHAARKQRLKGEKAEPFLKNPKTKYRRSFERQRRTVAHVVVSSPKARHSSLNRLLQINRTPLHWFSPRAHHARVSQCRNRSSRRVSKERKPYRSLYAIFERFFSFLSVEQARIQAILFVRFERDNELHRLGDRKKSSKRENGLSTDGDLFVSKISANPSLLQLSSARNARDIRAGGDNGLMNQRNILKVAENIVAENINRVWQKKKKRIYDSFETLLSKKKVTTHGKCNKRLIFCRVSKLFITI